MNKAARSLIITLFAALALIVLLNAFGGSANLIGQSRKDFKLTEFVNEVKAKNVVSASWQGSDISGTLKTKQEYSVTATLPDSPAGADLMRTLEEYGVIVKVEKPPISQGVLTLISLIGGPLLVLLAIWFFFVRPAQSGNNPALSFGRSKARRVGETGQKVTFEDVAGIDEATQELYEIVDFLKNTKKYVALGAKIPKGILLTGPPGVGKTHLARAIAGEAGVPFYHISGSDFVEMFVGVGAARVRDLFETAKAHRPCLIFVDEIDAVGRQRGAGLGGGHDEREQTLNQLLVEMDGFDPNTGVIMIAATNRPDVLDPALLRPGRFDRQIVVDPPDAKGREMILKIHAKGKPFDTDVDLEIIAKRTPGFTGADLANSLNESALLAARRNKTRIAMDDIEEALDRVMAGPQRKSRLIDAKEKEILAYHEAGHAVIGELLENCDPVHKVTILPRGMSLGSTWSLPEQDKYLVSEQELLDDITMLLGGHVAEDLVYGSTWTGSSNDLERVTRIARAMVCEYGMSEKLGSLALGHRSRNPFLGRDYYEDRNYSEDVARQIDTEVHDIVERCKARATELLTANRDKLDRLVQALLEFETLDREAFLAVMDGRPMPERVAAPSIESPSDEAAADGDKNKPRIAPPTFEPGPA